MTKAIAQLWNGNLEPIRHLGKNNPEIKHLENLMQRTLERLEESLDDRQKKFFEKYNDNIHEYVILTVEQAFCDGFCLGTTLAVEAMTGAEQLL